MRFFTFLIVAFATIISANASIIQKREFSLGFDRCSGGITNSKNDIIMLSEEANRITSNLKPYSEKLSEVIRKLNSFNSNVSYCCKTVAPHMNGQAVNAIPAYMSSIINEYDKLIQVLIHKKVAIGENANILASTKYYVEHMKQNIDVLFQCVTPDKKPLLAKLLASYYKYNASYGS